MTDMLKNNEFKRALQAGRAQIGVWSTIPSPFVSELVAGSGYDWVLLDTEHTPTDVPLMLNQLQAVGKMAELKRAKNDAYVKYDIFGLR